MENAAQMFPGLRRFRWGWLIIAVIEILETPSAVISAVRMVHSDHRLWFVPFISFPIHFGMIWFFLKLWWDYRPEKGKPTDPSTEE